jgi:hypothetical protein
MACSRSGLTRWLLVRSVMSGRNSRHAQFRAHAQDQIGRVALEQRKGQRAATGCAAGHA